MVSPGTRVHFIGIGGIGVSAVARIAIGRGLIVSGSDVRRSQLTDAMEALGARVFIGHDERNLDGVDLVVVSTAIPDHNPELVAARRDGRATVHRSELLAAFLRCPVSIGVTGTHGKGTTAAMIARVLDAAGRDPGFIIGGLLNDYGVNARAGAGDVMVAEVDESDGSHRNAPVTHLLCNFLEADHLNYYDDLEHIIASMAEAVSDNPRLEQLFVNGDCAGNRELLRRVSIPAVTYGVETDCDYRATLVGSGQLPIRFVAYERGESLGEFSLPLPGLYNVVNAMGALAVARHMGVAPEAIREGLARFTGLQNRFTIADAAGVAVVKDYNSHPTAIRKVLESARGLTDGRVFSVFKPYRYTLTHYLKDEYATAFRGSDHVIITTMYAANEDPIPGVDTQFVVDMLRREGHDVIFVPDQTQIVDALDEHVVDGDQVIFFGGDDFFQMADAWAAQRRNSRPK
ncbi:MAG: UDP-N-acetylmuramate--L-alanine ligase [Myxococcales bacterium]|nr:UDP-N-acetylmuramate--L-alanine ligase [Myxococcales bacterium]MCB9520017.1 UDP-N-acetylmuramate--L-alanine ligase [Myxococcales bacterium]